VPYSVYCERHVYIILVIVSKAENETVELVPVDTQLELMMVEDGVVVVSG
jgi:hypothetical protein